MWLRATSRRSDLLVAATLALAACAPAGSASAPKPMATATAVTGPRVVLPSGRVVSVELALTDEEKAQGLMFRESMAKDHGMVFVFAGLEKRPFWMKNCHFPLDMIYTRSDGTIVDVLKNVPPCPGDPCPSFAPNGLADTVVEVNAGVADAEKAVPGAKLVYREVPGR